MNQTETLLNCVARNALTGKDATAQLIKRVEDSEMRRELVYQQEQYRAVHKQAEDMLSQMGKDAEAPGPMAKMGMWAGVMMNTAMDKSNAHIADIMIQGATMGVVDTTKARNECVDASAEAQGVASSFITQQQDSIERMTQFLVCRGWGRPGALPPDPCWGTLSPRPPAQGTIVP